MLTADTYLSVLEDCLAAAMASNYEPPKHIAAWLETILGSNKNAVLTVVVTSLLKKSVAPGQDIRLHQKEMPGGYSGRSLDTKFVTPFMKDHDFPCMAESGWLTRSLENKVPYNLDYTGAIAGSGVKEAFLSVLDAIQRGDADARDLLTYVFGRLSVLREQNHVALAKPTGLTIGGIVKRLDYHFGSGGRGKSRLPTLAVYAAYRQMVGKHGEVGRYRRMSLKELESHTTADSRTGAVGDIEVVDPSNGRLFEAVEIKHGHTITAGMVRDAYNKFKSEPVQRYYILSTRGGGDFNAITQEIIRIHREHGCQVIVNGVIDTLKYYLRLLKNPDCFVVSYVSLVEMDPALKYEHRVAWNRIVSQAET